MDAGKIFVIVLTVLVVGLLFFLEMKARRTRRNEVTPPKLDQ
jgi:heme/copper-type cytochrome/quinol oxidase subunit 2